MVLLDLVDFILQSGLWSCCWFGIIGFGFGWFEDLLCSL